MIRQAFECARVGAVTFALFAAGKACAAEPRPFSPRDLVSLDRVSDLQISPDRGLLAYQLRVADSSANTARQEIWLLDTGEGAQPRRLAGAVHGASSPRWSRNGSGLFFLSKQSGSSQVWRIGTNGQAPLQVTNLPLPVTSFRLSPNGRHIVVSMAVFRDCKSLECTKERLRIRPGASTAKKFSRQPVRYWDRWSDGTNNHLFALALDANGIAGGTARDLMPGFDGDSPTKPEGDDGDYAITPDGSTVIFSAFDASAPGEWGTNLDLYSAPITGSGELTNLTLANDALDFGPVLSPDGRFLAYRSTRRRGHEADRFAIKVREISTGAVREVAAGWDRSAETLKWSNDGSTLYTIARDIGQSRVFSISLASGKATALTGKGRVSSFEVGKGKLILALENLSSPTQIYFLRGGRLSKATNHNSARLNDVEFGQYEQFSFTGWNGDKVYGYLVRPPGFDPRKKYPVAFLIHGGPQGSLSNFFDYRWNAQAYAGHGFAVLMIDFHGSKGYGQAFSDAVRNHWGDRPLEDLRKGWEHALSRYPFLDADNACALGASYGGFMVNWIASQWKAPWKCLVNHAGILDYRMMSYAIDLTSFVEWESEGTPFEKPANFARFNPIDHVAQWSIPMLVAHGEKDFRVPFDQSIATFAALQWKNIPSELLVYPDENHRILGPANSLNWYETVLEWLDRWTRNGGGHATGAS